MSQNNLRTLLENHFNFIGEPTPRYVQAEVKLQEVYGVSRKQIVSILWEERNDETKTCAFRISSYIVSREKALKALLINKTSSVRKDNMEEAIFNYSIEGNKILSLLLHNERLRGVHLHLGKEYLIASSDLIFLSGTIDECLLFKRIQALAIIADSMEKRLMGPKVDIH